MHEKDASGSLTDGCRCDQAKRNRRRGDGGPRRWRRRGGAQRYGMFITFISSHLILSNVLKWCTNCSNGGDSIDCSFCPRTLCMKCLKIPSDKGLLKDYLGHLFKCPYCYFHSSLRDRPYMVGFFLCVLLLLTHLISHFIKKMAPLLIV